MQWLWIPGIILAGSQVTGGRGFPTRSTDPELQWDLPGCSMEHLSALDIFVDI